MKRNRGFLLTTLTLLIIGILLCFGSFAVVGFDFKAYDTRKPLENKQYVEEREVKSINLDIESVYKIEIAPTEDTKVTIDYMASEEMQYTFTLDNVGNLVVANTENYKWYHEFFNFNYNYTDKVLIIKVPQGKLDELTIDADNSNVDVKNITVNNFSASADNGKVNVDNLKVAGKTIIESDNGSATITNSVLTNGFVCETKNGQINIENLNSFSIDLNAKNGSINIKNTTVTTDIIATSANGRVELNNVTAQIISLEVKSGKIILNDITAQELKSISKNGAIAISNIDVSKKLDLKADNGSVKGTVKGTQEDFNIRVTAKNGSSNIKTTNNNAQKELLIGCNNGSIAITFK